MRLATEPPVAVERPLLRGALHGVAFAAALGVGVRLFVCSRESRVLPAAVFAASAALMLGTSTLYHPIEVDPATFEQVREHSLSFLVAPGTKTSIARLSSTDERAT